VLVSFAADLRWVLLAARRTLPLGLALVLAAWLGLVAWFAPAADSAELAAADGAAVERGLQRAHAWGGLLLVATPALVALVLRQVGAARRREREWLASTPLARSRLVVATWLGTGLAALGLVTLAGVAIELAVGPSGPARRVLGRVEAATFAVSDAPRSFAIGAVEAGTLDRVRFDLRALGPGSATVEVGVAGRPTDARRFELGTHRRLVLELPPGPGPWTVTIRRVDRVADGGADRDATFVVPAGGIELLGAGIDDRAAAAEVAARAWLALIGWSGLALGLGAWLSVPLAFLSLAALQVAAALADEPPRAWPGIELGAAIAHVGRGELPAPLELGSVVATLGVAAAGLGLALLVRGGRT